MLMGVGTHIKDRQETGDACNVDKGSPQFLLNTSVRNEQLTICVPTSVSVCVWLQKSPDKSHYGVST